MSEPGAFSTVIELAAPPDRVFDHFVDPALLVRWMGDYARLVAVDGGVFSVDINGVLIRGQFVRIERPSYLEVTWGEAGNPAMPPGATTLRLRFAPVAAGTRLELDHVGLSAEELGKHAMGWPHFLGRLTVLAGGGDPGPDPFASAPRP